MENRPDSIRVAAWVKLTTFCISQPLKLDRLLCDRPEVTATVRLSSKVSRKWMQKVESSRFESRLLAGSSSLSYQSTDRISSGMRPRVKRSLSCHMASKRHSLHFDVSCIIAIAATSTVYRTVNIRFVDSVLAALQVSYGISSRTDRISTVPLSQ